MHWLRDAFLTVLVGYVVLVGLMVALGWTLVHPLGRSVGAWDESVNRWFAARRTTFWDDTTGVATWLINTPCAIAIAAIMVTGLSLLRRIREAVMIVVALALELVVFLSANSFVDRPRPNVPRLNATPSTSSFPSGHTAAAVVLFAGLAIAVTCCTRRSLARITAVIVAVVMATLVAFGRVYRGLHHPTDVFGGAILGAACLAVAIIAVRAKAPPRAPKQVSTPRPS